MSLRARVDAMKPSTQGATRTAPPRPPDNFPTRGNYVPYLAFGSCGFFLVAVAILVLEVVWALGSGPEAWASLQAVLAHPLSLAFSLLAAIAMIWFALRLFAVFPKTQPPKIGPFPRPSDAIFAVALNGAFVVATLIVVLVLGGMFP